MRRLALIAFVVAFVAAACSSQGTQTPGGPAGAPLLPQVHRHGSTPISHVVIVVQENRSFDNFFDCFPGTDCVKNAPGPGPQPGPTSQASPCPNPLSTPSPGPTPTPIALKFGANLPDYDIDHTYCSAFIYRIRQWRNGRVLLGRLRAKRRAGDDIPLSSRGFEAHSTLLGPGDPIRLGRSHVCDPSQRQFYRASRPH
ncbi:MAG: hypothetical protein JOZ01_09170, partial [Candidatus Eremiobacteraeota bacterium]|nr:hypothetical protein [Candidatus Eremiobacteraeota bacterium]